MKVKVKVIKYGDNIDTDVIIPARYLNSTDEKELASHCMEDLDKSFAARVKQGDIMVAGHNFGCGSSREHAPLSIKASGISCIVAMDFARIFYRNAINIGLPILECAQAVTESENGDEFEIDFDTGVIENITRGKKYQTPAFPPFLQNIISAGGLLNTLKDGGLEARGMTLKIAVVKGDGIGPEVVSSAIAVLSKVCEKFGHAVEYREVLAGGCAIDQVGEPLPQKSIDICKGCDAVLLGAIGGPKWDNLASHLRPERAILGLRKALGLYANLRPVKLYDALAGQSPLRAEVTARGIDLLFVRELTGGIYFGDSGRRQSDAGEQAFDTEIYSELEIERIGVCAFELAMKRRRSLISIDKANVLESSKLWREVMHRLSARYPEVSYRDMLVDNAAMQLVRDPASQFDVAVASNLFGDILTDEAAVLTGSIGLLPSASLGTGTLGLYEPIHGSAPDIAGKGVANPVGTVLSAASMLRFTFSLEAEAKCIEDAVDRALVAGLRTADLASPGKPVSTQEMTAHILENI